ncbi:MAG: MBL fold metallo-hydrolase [Deltaproteobacteria bacterium]|nr:MBL fold metallo-hydrolase [Deltaproteobacteria bacterium]
MVRVSTHGDVTRFDLARTLAGRGRYWTVAYLLDGTMIDTGGAHTAPELVDALASARIDRVANTHSHEDHIGANGAIQRLRGVPIHAHPKALAVLADPRRLQPEPLYRRVFWGYPEPSLGSGLADGEVVPAGRFRLRAVHTPGHAPDHVCFFEEEQGRLFTGDLYVGGFDRALRVGFDVLGVIESLKKVAALPARMLFPGAARVPDGDPGRILREKVAYLEERVGRVRELRRQGRGIGSIARAVFGGPMPIEVLTGFDYTRRAMVRSMLGEWQGLT